MDERDGDNNVDGDDSNSGDDVGIDETGDAEDVTVMAVIVMMIVGVATVVLMLRVEEAPLGMVMTVSVVMVYGVESGDNSGDMMMMTTLSFILPEMP